MHTRFRPVRFAASSDAIENTSGRGRSRALRLMRVNQMVYAVRSPNGHATNAGASVVLQPLVQARHLTCHVGIVTRLLAPGIPGTERRLIPLARVISLRAGIG